MKIDDKVKIGKSIDDSNPIQLKFIGQIGVISKMNDGAPSVLVKFESGSIESFWPEELTKVR